MEVERDQSQFPDKFLRDCAAHVVGTRRHEDVSVSINVMGRNAGVPTPSGDIVGLSWSVGDRGCVRMYHHSDWIDAIRRAMGDG